RHTRFSRDWSSDVCSSDLKNAANDIRSATASAQELLGRLGVNISEQIDASSATEGYLDGLMSRSRAEDLYRRAMNDPSVLADLSDRKSVVQGKTGIVWRRR